MKFLKTPFFIGTAQLSNNILYAPLAGCSDLPFRSMACRYRPGLVYCEMIKIDALVRNDAHTYRLLDYSSDMHPIGAQICGSKPKVAAIAAKIVEDLGFDLIDFNCGCPVDKVTKDGSGSGMLKNPELIGDVLCEVMAAVKIPVTLKIRAGWDEQTINAPLITQIAERAGAKAIAIHGRTRAQGYKGPANWEYIRACVDVATEIIVIGNGDVFDAQSALRMFQYTGCDAVLVSRGTMGQPWIVEDIISLLKGQPAIERNVVVVRKALIEHFKAIIQSQNEKQSLLDFRRVGCWYLKRCEGARTLRMHLNKATSTSEVFTLIDQFAWDTIELSAEMEDPI